MSQPDRNEMALPRAAELAVAAPEVDIRVATFTIADGALYLLLDRADGIQQLPRTVPSRF